MPIYIPPLRERREDIGLLFRKFAVDFAEKYQMPPIKLSPDAHSMLSSYYWRGNIRQLKNVTEQISVIEQHREIDAERLRLYLPDQDASLLPTLYSGRAEQEQKSFNNEREILYQVLFEMKRDMAELKKLVHDIMSHENMDLSSFSNPNVGVMSPTSVSSELMNVIQPSVPMQSSLITE